MDDATANLKQAQGVITTLEELLERWLASAPNAGVNRLECLDGTRQCACFDDADKGPTQTYTSLEERDVRGDALCALHTGHRVHGVQSVQWERQNLAFCKKLVSRPLACAYLAHIPDRTIRSW